MGETLQAELRIGGCKQRIVRAEVVLESGIIGLAKEPSLIELLRLPRKQSLFDLLGKTIRIGSRAKCFFGENARGFVVPMPIIWRAGEARADDVRTELPDHAYEIAQRSIVSTPFLDGLLRILGVAKIGNPGEAEINAVILRCRQEFKRAENTQFIGEGAAGFILSSFATC